jgi:hypothetical protein
VATLDEILLALAPELGSVDEDRRTVVLALADSRTGNVYPADIRPQAVALMAAHMLTMSNGVTSSGKITSKTVGPLSITYGGGSGSDLGRTGYGQQLLELQNAYVIGFRTRVEL